MNSQVKVAFLSGDEVIDFKVLYCLYRAYPNIHIICNDEKSLIKYSRYKKTFQYVPWSVSADGQDEIANQIKDYCDKEKVEIIVTGGSESAVFLNRYQDIFSNQKLFPTSDEQTIENTDNKWLFAKTLMAEGISTPFTMLIDGEGSVADEKKTELEEKIGFPLIVKPVHGDGGLGVRLIHDFEELKDHVLGKHAYNDLPLIVQEYIDGYDIDYSFVSIDGEVLTSAVQRWVDPDALDFCKNDEVEKLATQIIGIFSYSGPGHFDMIIDNKNAKAYVLEINPRFWRSVPAAMWAGLNMVQSAVDATLGKEFKRDGAAGTYILPGTKIKKLIKKPWTYFSLSKEDRQEIWFIITDPMPQLAAFFGKGFGS